MGRSPADRHAKRNATQVRLASCAPSRNPQIIATAIIADMQDLRSLLEAFSLVRLIVSILLAATFSGACLQADAPVFRTLAGCGGSGSADGSGSAAQFASIAGIAVDGRGNVFVADSLNHTVRQISPTGVVTTIAGFAGQAGSADGIGSEARFDYPVDVAVDKTGNLYVCDYFNFTIRKITPDGAVSTFAGRAGAGGSADGVGSAARFGMTGSGIGPAGIAIDSAGNVFVSDPVNNTIRRISPDGVVSTWAGKVGEWGTSDGTGGEARFSDMRGLAIDSFDNLYVADAGAETIRKITPERIVTTIAGSSNNSGSTDGAGNSARFSGPRGVALDQSGSIYVADTRNSTLRMIASGGGVTTFAGSAGMSGYVEGAGAAVRFAFPADVAVDANGYLYVADTNNGAIRTTAPALITAHPASQVVAKNESVSFRVATIWPSPSFQWNRNGLPIPGATSSTLILPMVGDSDVGTYTATIANGATTVTSNPATLTLSGSVYAIPYQFTTIGGRPGVTGSAGGSVGKLRDPSFIVQDSQGNLFVTDGVNYTIRKITPSGAVSTFAGAAGQSGAADGAGDTARFSGPSFLAIDKNDQLFVSDYGAIRKITPTGMVSTITGVVGSPGNVDGAGALARVSPAGLAVDSNGVIYFADPTNSIVRRVSPNGVVSLLAGCAGGRGNSDGPGEVAWFRSPYGVAVDAAGTIYVSDGGNHNVRRITPSGVVSTFAGSTDPFGEFDYRDGTGTDARFHAPSFLWMSAAGDLFVGDTGNSVVRKISPNGVVTTALCTDERSFSASTALHTKYAGMSGLVVDKSGAYILTNSILGSICRVSPAGEIRVLAGHPGHPGVTDSDGPAMLFNEPRSVAVLPDSSLVVADSRNCIVRKVVPPAGSEVLAGWFSEFAGAGLDRSDTLVDLPVGVATDRSGDIYVADLGKRVIRKIDNGGHLSVLAGAKNITGCRDGEGSDAWFSFPMSVATDSVGNVYVADRENCCIRKITPIGTVTTFAGSGSERGSADGPRLNARFMVPSAVAVDAADNLYVADTGNHKVRKISASGEVTTLAGSGLSGSSDGTGAAASFDEPQGLAVDDQGTVFVSDTGNHTIRRITASGEVTTIGGSTQSIGSSDGAGSSSRFNSPIGLAVDAAGSLYVADTYNHTIRKGVPVTRPEVSSHPINQTMPDGGIATFSVSVGSAEPMTYLWMCSPDGGSTWLGLDECATYSGVAGATLSVRVRGAMNAYQYRCLVRNSGGGASASNVATLTIFTPFAVWRQQHFGTAAGTGTAADDADPDLDGRSNLLEYALGSVPTAADTGSPSTAGSVTDGTATHLTLTFNRIADPALTYTVEASDDLVAWTSILTSTGGENVAGPVVVTDSETVEDHGRRFLRLQVTN